MSGLPVLAAPTQIQVSWEDGPAADAMCAIDALGISATLGRPVITATAGGWGAAGCLTAPATWLGRPAERSPRGAYAITAAS
jgi:hypothetical protein